MKKILFIGLVLIALLFVMPSAVSAETDTVVVQGSIGGSIAVTATPDTIDFGAMVAGTPETGSTQTSVTTTYTTWSLTASDAATATKGFMYKTGPVKLANALKIGTGTPTATLVTNPYSIRAGTAAGTFTDTINVAQDIAGTDAEGSYTMTITFTASSG
jgi:hypothetical protein